MFEIPLILRLLALYKKGKKKIKKFFFFCSLLCLDFSLWLLVQEK